MNDLDFERREARRGRWPLTLALAGCLAVATAAGCGRSGPAVQPVEGTVLLDGKALDGATVGFTPVDQGGLPAVGLTGSDGRFKLTSTGGGAPEAGAVVGDYAVVISKQEVEGTGRQVEGPAMPVPPSTAYPQQPRIFFVVPRGYEQAASSGLRATVKRGKNEVRFELDSAFKGL
jgi:hypothetical protein